MKWALFNQAGGSFTALFTSGAVGGAGAVTGAELSALLFCNALFAGEAGAGWAVETAGSLFAGKGGGAEVGAEGGAGGATGGSGDTAASGGEAGVAFGAGTGSLAGSGSLASSATVAVCAGSSLGTSAGSSLTTVFSLSAAARVTACKPVLVAVAG